MTYINNAEINERSNVDRIYNTHLLLCDFFDFTKYKRLPLGLSITAGILLCPFLLAIILLAAFYYLTIVSYKIVITPADYILSFMKKEGKSTQVKVAIYLTGYPTVFLFKFAAALLNILFTCNHFLIALFAYLYGLGGINPLIFMFDKVYEDKTYPTAECTKNELIKAIILFIIGILLLIIIIVSCIPFESIVYRTYSSDQIYNEIIPIKFNKTYEIKFIDGFNEVNLSLPPNTSNYVYFYVESSYATYKVCVYKDTMDYVNDHPYKEYYSSHGDLFEYMYSLEYNNSYYIKITMEGPGTIKFLAEER